MKSIFRLYLLFLFAFITSVVTAQFPANFEFLEHLHAKSKLGAQKVHNDAIYFVSHNNYKPHTLISKATADGTFEVLLKPQEYDARKSKLFVESDSSFQLVLYDLFDYDVPTGGIYVLNVKGSEHSIDTIIDTNLFPVFQSFHNITKDANGDWISISNNRVYLFNKTGLIKSEPLPSNSFYPDLFSNNNGNLFFITNSPNRKSSLSSYENGTLTVINEYEVDNNLYHLATNEKGIFLSTGNELFQYNDDFSVLLNSWDESSFEGQIQSSNYINGKLEILTTTSDQHFLYRINSDNEMEQFYQNTKGEGEAIVQFEYLDGNQYLFTGTFSIEDISKNIFFRNVNVMDNSGVEYPRVDIAFADLELVQTRKDTYDIIVSPPDTFYGIEYFYDVSATIENESGEMIQFCNAFSQEHDSYPYYVGLDIEGLDLNSTINADTTAVSYYSQTLDQITMALPGGNFKFNINSNNTITANAISTIINPITTKLLSVYPNPVSDLLKLNNEKTHNAVTIFDSQGRMVYYNNGNQTELDVSNLNSGNYIISVKSPQGERLSMGKFIKL